jgi:nitrite reductase/ring-hydroxylating ferredoxin subunit/uncharacterized membrane protein
MIGTQIERALHALPTSAAQIEQAITRIPGLEQAGTWLARGIHSAVLAGDDLTRTVADILHGSWLGHPLHPVLSDIPIGAWTLAEVFDAMAAAGGGSVAEHTADSLIAIGALAAVPTALTGLADYSAIREDAIAYAAAHGALNSAGLGLYLLSLWARSRKQRRLGVALSAAGLVSVAAAAWIGGDMVYRRRIGVDNAPEAPGPKRWTAVLPLSEIAAYEARRVEIDDAPVLIYNDGGAIYAIGAVCSHAGGPLEDGTFDGHCVECPWHQSVFDLRDGQVVHGPATQAQPNYQVRIRSGQIEIRSAPQGERQQAKLPDTSTRKGEQEREVGGSGTDS